MPQLFLVFFYLRFRMHESLFFGAITPDFVRYRTGISGATTSQPLHHDYRLHLRDYFPIGGHSIA